jgi:hypothetical protein
MRFNGFPLGSVESRAAARKLVQNRHSADDWKTITLEFDTVAEAKGLAMLFRNVGRDVRLIAETGKEIPF